MTLTLSEKLALRNASGRPMKRPDMSGYFRSRINRHVNGICERVEALPAGVRGVTGEVTDPVIEVTMLDGTVWRWRGGEYAARKVNLCRAPLMPKPCQ